MDISSPCYLMKQDGGAVFGPVRFQQLKEWAESAQISPMDLVSNDQLTWAKAPTVPELEMDWLVQSSPGQLYGPTTTAALKEFLRAGEITHASLCINCVDGEHMRVGDIPQFKRDEELETGQNQPGRASVRENLQQRVRELEALVHEERRAREIAEEQYARLAARFTEQTDNAD